MILDRYLFTGIMCDDDTIESMKNYKDSGTDQSYFYRDNKCVGSRFSWREFSPEIESDIFYTYEDAEAADREFFEKHKDCYCSSAIMPLPSVFALDPHEIDLIMKLTEYINIDDLDIDDIEVIQKLRSDMKAWNAEQDTPTDIPF